MLRLPASLLFQLTTKPPLVSAVMACAPTSDGTGLTTNSEPSGPFTLSKRRPTMP
jgi:hypothetical protein